MEQKDNGIGSHPKNEFGNLWTSQSLIKDWGANPQWRSYDVIPCLFESLGSKGKITPEMEDAPKLGSILRNNNAHPKGFPENLFVEGPHIYLLTAAFSNELDKILKQSPKTTEQVIHDAAFAYYVFERIHPFVDGNGRIGRMIAKRILKGAKMKDPVFHDQRWYGNGGRSSHLESLQKVNETNNLAHLELFFAEALINRYDSINEKQKHMEIKEIIQKKRLESQGDSGNTKLKDIWGGFAGLPLYGNR